MISCRSFWIQNGLWAIFGYWVISKTILGVFEKNWNCDFPWKCPKLFCLYLSNQIPLSGRFVFKTNSMISSITSCKDHYCSFFYKLRYNGNKDAVFRKIAKNTQLWAFKCAASMKSLFFNRSLRKNVSKL